MELLKQESRPMQSQFSLGGDEPEQIVFQESRIIVAEDQHINQ
jgi:hypothetical protein